ncbi:MAG: hypothetical protein E7323_08885 [Clostridiales bacterium]|nr:hypothetical protein [Clostridiales bacterium]
MTSIAMGLSLFFALVLLAFLLYIWRMGRRERLAPRQIPGETLPAPLREGALCPLRQLNAYYAKRDPEAADTCIDETMQPEAMLILGTGPAEIFHGREGARWLLQGDWKHWGLLQLDVEQTALNRVGSALWFATHGQVKLDLGGFRVPIRITGMLVEQDGLWKISKLQFVNAVDSNYLIVAWIPALALAASLMLLGLSRLIFLL